MRMKRVLISVCLLQLWNVRTADYGLVERIQHIDNTLVKLAEQLASVRYQRDVLTQKMFSQEACDDLWQTCCSIADKVDRYKSGEHIVFHLQNKNADKMRRVARTWLDSYERMVRSVALQTAVKAPIFSKQQLCELRYVSPGSQSDYWFVHPVGCGIAQYWYPVARARADIRQAYMQLCECVNTTEDEQEILGYVREQLQRVDRKLVQSQFPMCERRTEQAREVITAACRELGVPESTVVPVNWQDTYVVTPWSG